LKCAKEEYESAGQIGAISFHPEARAYLWGAAFGRMADHCREIGDTGRALFFALAAWNTSKHPIFAYNGGILAAGLGDVGTAEKLLKIYLAQYKSLVGTPMYTLATPGFTADDFERLAITAEERLSELK
jgi:hypothetical protein